MYVPGTEGGGIRAKPSPALAAEGEGEGWIGSGCCSAVFSAREALLKIDCFVC